MRLPYTYEISHRKKATAKNILYCEIPAAMIGILVFFVTLASFKNSVRFLEDASSAKMITSFNLSHYDITT